MYQINFRVSSEEYEIIKLYSEFSDKSIPSIMKENALIEIKKKAKILAIELYRQNKIGFKQAFKLSFLSFHEFIQLLIENDIEPNISDELDNCLIENVKKITFEDIFPNKTKDEIRALLKNQ